MSKPITVEHEGITITYRESDNRWAFELRGRQRSSESLEKAKEVIEKPVDEKEKSFTRIPIYIAARGYGTTGYDKAEITSIAEGGCDQTPSVWISRGKERSKENSFFCFVFNDANAELISEIDALQTQIDALKTQLNAKVEKLQRVTL